MMKPAINWLPIEQLNRKTDNTYLVRVENAGGGTGPGWIEKGYFADDTQRWYSDGVDRNGSLVPLEREGIWQVTAFAPWPELSDPPSFKSEIATEIYRAFEGFGALSDLLSIIGSYGDTMDDADVLSMLRDWNDNSQSEAA